MANMTFKTNLLPNSDLGYSLGSSDQRWKINDLAGGPIEYIVNTNTAKSSAWTGTTKDSKLTLGKVIALKINNTPFGNASLNLTFTDPAEGDPTTSGAIAIYLNNTRVTTHYANGSVILMVYDGTNWRSTDYWNSNSRDAGYGKITPQQSDAETAITPNTTQLVAATYNEAMKVAAGNKWVQFAGTNGASGADVLTVGHSLSGVTAGDYGDSTTQTPGYGDTFNVPYISVDAAGHVTEISSHTVKIPASDNTTYTFSDGTAGNFTVTPSGGTAQTVSIGKPATAGTADKATADASGNTITTTYLTKASGVTAVTWDSTNKKITRTINGSAADVVQFAAGSNITLTGASGTLTIASTDTNNAVTQTETTANNDYRLLLSSSADTATTTAGAGKSTNLRFNPSSKVFSVGGDIEATGDLTLTGDAYLNNETYADSITAGGLIVTGNAAFSNIPTAPTPAAASNDTSVATTAFVKNAFTTNDAMVFKGTIGSSGATTTALPATHSQGWTYKVITAGEYAGQQCEIGDTIYCITDGTAANNAHWTVVQTNIDGAVIGPAESTVNNIAVFNGTTGKVISDSGITTTTTAPSNSSDNTMIPTSQAVWTAITGASGYGKTGTVTSVQVQASAPLQSSTSASQSTSLSTTISFINQTANYVLAGPSSGSSAAPTFRQLVADDIPSISKSKISDFPTSMAPTSHTHGNISNDGKVGSTANYAVYTTTGGAITATSFEVTAPTASGSATAFITSVSQDSKGQISASKANLPTASTAVAGIVQLSSATNSTATDMAATPSAVKAAYDLAASGSDIKQNITLASTSKAFITGVVTTPTAAAQALEGVADTGVYLTAIAGELSAVRHSFNVSGTEKAYMIYNSTTNAIDFVFV